ncbi:MAG: hypothetical protein ACTHZI_11750 [Luteimonas sp.]
MNVSNPRPSPRAPVAPARPAPRYRGTGVGYGSSSGYFKRRGYSRSSMSPRFRMG